MHYLAQLKDRAFVKDYWFLSFAKNMGKNIGINISKKISGKYSPGMLAMHQKLLHLVRKSAADALLQKVSFKKQQKQLVIDC